MKRIVVGLTGGIASGKTTVLTALARVGFPVISTDEVSHNCLRPGHTVFRAVLRKFGKDILDPHGRIDRHKLGKIVFARQKQLRWLQRQIHPHVMREVNRFVRRRAGIVVVDVPLLFEARWLSVVDRVIVVYCTRAQQIARIRRRNGLSSEEIRQRLAAQWPLLRKKARADIVIDNTGTQRQLKKEISKLVENLKKT